MKWISVKDKLPKEIKKYLVIVRRATQVSNSIEIAGRYTHKPAVGDSQLDKNFMIPGQVTHWMPLPEKPE